MNIMVVGHGGHSKVIADMILSTGENTIVGFLDDRYNDLRLIDGIYLGSISSAREILNKFNDVKFVIAIGDNRIRQSTFQRLGLSFDNYITVIHSSAMVSPTAKVGYGTVVMPNSVINADSQIGHHTIINTSSVVEHDSILGNFSHVCPSATLTGTVHLGEGTYVGAGATIIPNIKVGKWAIIGAGATVITDIPSFSTAVGIPARVKKVLNILGGE
jgi:acetyltransferase EpsM